MLSQGCLDEGIRLEINGGRCLIHHNDLGVTKEGTREAQQLTLTNGIVFPIQEDDGIKAAFLLGHMIMHVCAFKGEPDVSIRVNTTGIQVETQAAGEEDWFLGDNGKTRSKVLQTHLANVNVINENLTG